MGIDHRRDLRSIFDGPWIAFICAAAIAVGLAGVISRFHPALFYPYFATIPPVITVAAAAIIAAAAIWALDRFAGFSQSVLQFRLAPTLFAFSLAVPFAALAILIDLTMRFDADINVALPWAAAFYPAIAFFVETALHTLPFALIYLLAQGIWRMRRIAAVLAVTLPSMIEPALQIYYASEGGVITALALVVGVHVFAINIAQLTLFHRHGFWAMLAFRLTYYALWHIAWGEARLSLLF